MIKKSAYPMSCPQHSVGAGVGFDTGKGREGTQEPLGRSVTRAKHIKKLILIHVSGTEQICNTGKTNFKIR